MGKITRKVIDILEKFKIHLKKTTRIYDVDVLSDIRHFINSEKKMTFSFVKSTKVQFNCTISRKKIKK